MAIPTDERRPFPGLGRDPASVRQRVEAMEKLLERLFVIPGIKQPVGLDVILDLVPVVGEHRGGRDGRLYRVGSEEPRHVQVADGAHGRQCGARLGTGTGFSDAGDWGRSQRSFSARTPSNLKIIKRHLDKHHAAYRGDRRGSGCPSVAAAGDPDVLAFDLIGNRPSVAVGAGAIAKALLDQPASQGVELGDAAGARDRAPGHSAVGADREGELDAPANPVFAKAARIIGRRYVAGDLFEVGAPLAFA